MLSSQGQIVPRYKRVVILLPLVSTTTFTANLRHNLRHAKTFFKKTYPCGSGYNTATSACYIYHFSRQIIQPSAQNSFRAEDFCSTIIETTKAKDQLQIGNRCAIVVATWSPNPQGTSHSPLLNSAKMSAHTNFFRKNTTHGKPSIYRYSRLSHIPLCTPNPQNVCAKIPKR